MKKTNISAVITVMILAILGWVIFSNKDSLFVSQEKDEGPQIETKKEVSLIINNGEGSPLVVNNEFKEGMTAFDLLEEKTEELGLVLETKTFDFGILVEVIGDEKNGENGKYWLYYINDEMPMVSSDQNKINPGDKIEFKFEESTF